MFMMRRTGVPQLPMLYMKAEDGGDNNPSRETWECDRPIF